MMRGWIIIGAVLALFLLAMSCRTADAHDWYPRNCCSDRDCYEIDASEIEWTLEGIKIKATGEVIAHDKIRRDAPDGRIYRCSWGGMPQASTIKTGEGPCFWMPEAGI